MIPIYGMVMKYIIVRKELKQYSPISGPQGSGNETTNDFNVINRPKITLDVLTLHAEISRLVEQPVL